MKNYSKINFPRTRITTLDVCEIGRKKHHMAALLEFDVTDTRLAIKNFRSRTGHQLSFTAWLIKTISQTVAEFQTAHAFLQTKRKAIIFEDIDFSITVEREYEGQLVPLPYIIKETNKKSFVEITEEIRAAKNQKLQKKRYCIRSKEK